MWHNVVVTAESLFLIYVAFLAGDLLSRLMHIEWAGGLRRTVYTIILGYGVISSAGVFLAFLGAFTFLYLNLFFITVVMVALPTVSAHVQRLVMFAWSRGGVTTLFRCVFREYTWLKILLAFWLLVNFAFVFVPVTGHDTKMYRMPLMLELVREGTFTFTSEVTEYLWMPLLAEITYAIPMVAFGNSTAPFVFQLLQYSALVLLLGLIYTFLRRRIAHPRLALIGLFLVLVIFDLQREIFHGGYTDVFVYLFGLASLLLVIDYCTLPHPRRGELILSAILLGFALSVKHTAGFIALANIIFVLAAFARERLPFAQQLKWLSAYALIALVIAGFWYAKNGYVFRDPFYIGGLSLGETIIAERTVSNMFLFPFHRFAIVGNKDSSSRLIVLGYFVFIYAIFLYLLLFDRKKIAFEHILFFVFSHLHLYLIFFKSHHTRYFIPALIVLPILVILLTDRLLHYRSVLFSVGTGQKLSRITRIALGVLLVLLFVGNIRYFYVKFLYKTGFLTEQEYIIEVGGL
ncbi:MAG: hypothetical protein U1A16_01660 [Patescibacteria group bacterium]|nr:hypothetical protein [Patescibacteria group bacterium]